MTKLPTDHDLRRRQREREARAHVGAAGWQQSATLERIIRAGREQLAATDALREVVSLSAQQIRALPLEAGESDRARHADSLAGILAAGKQQISAASALDVLISEALDQVLGTPTHEVNVGILERIQARVQRQVEALHTIINSARAQADTLERLDALDHLSAEHQARVGAIGQLSAEAEVEVLAEMGAHSVARIKELEDATPEQQLSALQRIGSAAVAGIGDLHAAPEKQAEVLEELAEAADHKAHDLREDGGN